MRLRFWGTRGSLPVALTAEECLGKVSGALLAAGGRRFADLEDARAFALDLPFHVARTFGGHSSCVEIERDGRDGEYVVCDLGTGARALGNAALARRAGREPLTFHVLMSHVHWDHIMGFPLFAPAYVPGTRIVLYGGHPGLEAAFRRQHGEPSFPVDFSALGAEVEFVQLAPGEAHPIAGMQVRCLLQRHAGDSYGYRLEHDGKAVVYSTDSEHKLDDRRETDAFVDFFRDADVVVFDAMYSLAEAVSIKEDWGHSSNVVGVELCQLARARHLVLFHHEPICDDARIAGMEAETRRFEEITRGGHQPLKVTAAYDGLVVEV